MERTDKTDLYLVYDLDVILCVWQLILSLLFIYATLFKKQHCQKHMGLR